MRRKRSPYVNSRAVRIRIAVGFARSHRSVVVVVRTERPTGTGSVHALVVELESCLPRLCFQSRDPMALLPPPAAQKDADSLEASTFRELIPRFFFKWRRDPSVTVSAMLICPLPYSLSAARLDYMDYADRPNNL
jgi:hypothetical protein